MSAEPPATNLRSNETPPASRAPGDAATQPKPCSPGEASVPAGSPAPLDAPSPGDSAPPDTLDALQARLGVRLRDRALLLRALTHHSYLPETAARDSYDTLEFLGDALIGAQVVEHIFRSYPEDDEGQMTALKSEVVSRRVLARIGARLGLMDAIRVDVANLRTFNDRSRESLCADALEALVGAIHLDQGREAAEAFVAREILPAVVETHATLGQQNPKGLLQQELQRRHGLLPRYEVLAIAGHGNDRSYTVGVYAGERLIATGQGPSIKEAGRGAARTALQQLTGLP
jgi:ribonuclease-3